MKWVPDNLDNYLNFYSVSGDGRVTNWTLIKCGLLFNDKLIINFDKVLENISKEMVAGHLMGKQASNFNINTLLVLWMLDEHWRLSQMMRPSILWGLMRAPSTYAPRNMPHST